MPKLSSDRLPKYRKHRASGQAIVTLNGKDHYLGVHGSKASRIEYDRLITEWIANGRQLPSAADEPHAISIAELIAAYWKHAQEHYRHADGTPTSEQQLVRLAMRPLKELYLRDDADKSGPLALKAVRQKMIDAGLCRGVVNSHVGRIRRMFKWAAENELVPVSAYQALATVAGLRRGRSKARETKPVKPVSEAHVNAVLPHVSPQVAAMIELQRLTGMRPGEVTTMRTCDLDTNGRNWTYTPATVATTGEL